MASESNSIATPKVTRAGKIVYGSAIAISLLGAVAFLCLRFSTTYPTFRLNGFAWMPMSGPVDMLSPHPFFRLMYNLTHPILTVGYVAVIVFLATRLIRDLPKTKSASLLHEVGIIAVLILFAAFGVSLFLPFGDMLEVIKNP